MAAVLTMSAGPFPIHRFTLSNGLPVIYAQKTDLPLTVLRLVVYAGKRDETDGKWGLANLTAEMLTEGTIHRTSDEISEEIEFLGAQLGVDAGIYTTQITLNILTSQLEKGLQLTSDLLQNPTFPDSELSKLKERIISSLQESLNDPDQVLDEAFRRALYDHHPLARPEEGTPSSIRALTRQDLEAFHRAFYTPKNAFLAVVTNLPQDDLKHLLEKTLGSWKGDSVEHRALPPLPSHSSPRVVLVPMKVNQAFVALGHYGVRRTDPDYPRIRLMNYILGGGWIRLPLFPHYPEQDGLCVQRLWLFHARL
jgi:zinc protease